MDWRDCNKCGGSYPEAFFRRNVSNASDTKRRRRPTCMRCEATSQDKEKRKNRWKAKARETLNRHAKKFIDRGLAVSIPDFSRRYGWDIGRIAHDMQHAYSNGCWNCGEQYLEMGHGYADITLDINDREQPPYYKANVRFMCQTCNRKKGKAAPEEWAAQQIGWELSAKHEQALKKNPMAWSPLFSWNASS